MPGLGLRYDEHGRPVGLDWPKPSATEKEMKDLQYSRPKMDRTGIGGRPRQEYCGSGLHLLAETGKEVKGGGRECTVCKKEKHNINQRARRKRLKEGSNG